MGMRIFPLPLSEIVVGCFWRPGRSVFTCVCESLHDCKKEFVNEDEEKANVAAMHHFIINNRVEIEMLTLSDLTDG